jgi:PadR family transcriptional regulator, regulatory protein PadR
MGGMDTELLKGTLALLILSLLSRKSMYGYELAATVHRDTEGAFTWREGSLYPSLHKLEQSGLIVGEWEERETGRKRRYYKLTKAGRAALKEKELDWGALCAAVNQVLGKSRGERG